MKKIEVINKNYCNRFLLVKVEDEYRVYEKIDLHIFSNNVDLIVEESYPFAHGESMEEMNKMIDRFDKQQREIDENK